MLSDSDRIILGISEKRDGSMKLLGCERDARVNDNLKAYFSKLNIKYNDIVFASTGHSANVKIVTKKDRGTCITNTDSIVTRDRGVILAITVADCLPIYFYDKRESIVGVAHAGWRGVVNNLPLATARLIKDEFNVQADEIMVKVGPHIRNCHFEVKDDVASKFKSYKDAIIESDSKTFIDLGQAVNEQLSTLNIPRTNIIISDVCTACSKNYYSYRRDKPKELQAMVAYIGIK